MDKFEAVKKIRGCEANIVNGIYNGSITLDNAARLIGLMESFIKNPSASFENKSAESEEELELIEMPDSTVPATPAPVETPAKAPVARVVSQEQKKKIDVPKTYPVPQTKPGSGLIVDYPPKNLPRKK